MSRLPAISRETLDAEGQATWDRIVAGRSAAAMRGPFAVLMHTPALADRVEHLEDYFRAESKLPAADRELIILAAVREMDARFAWARHEVRGKEAGTRSEAVEVLRKKGSSESLTPRERTLVEL